MTLFAATQILAVALVLIGALLLWNGRPVKQVATWSLRSLLVTIVLFGLGSGWFLWEISRLGEADFGNYRQLLLLFFGVIAVSSFFAVPDFLSVRGGAILVLLASKPFLDAAYMEDPRSRLFMVGFVYLSIVVALYLATLPYRLRDFFQWLFAKEIRPRVGGTILTLYGVFLCGVAFGY